MDDDLKKVIKKERKRLSRRRKEIRKKVKEELLALVERKVKEFKEYLEGWCGGRKEERKEGKA